MVLDISRHPCFDDKARHAYARVHLPVAPACNIQCNFCNRKFDCANESRPGVTSAVLKPAQAVEYLQRLVAHQPRTTVVGIAGPGDPFANAQATLDTLHRVRAAYPQMLLCVATNGLALPAHVPALARLQVSHVTITVNAVNPEIGARIYAWVRDGYRPYRGVEAAAILWQRQQEAIAALKAHGITVKINTIYIPTINDHHVLELARAVRQSGADLLNIIPLYPVAQTPFADLPMAAPEAVEAVRAQAGKILPQMRHCARCRADAAGMVGENTPPVILGWLREASAAVVKPTTTRPYVAAASFEGVLVNQHLGQADEFWVYGPDDTGRGYRVVDKRQAPAQGTGTHRWMELGRRLSDCRAVLVAGAGPTPQRVLDHQGLQVVVTEGLIEEALTAVYDGRVVPAPLRPAKCSAGCAGKGNGCG